jgi:PIN domain nuclease of toxin-antitoxin system
MRVLLDTHAFIWWNTSSSKLSPAALSLFQNEQDTLMLSLASVWEIQIKLQLGKLTLPAPLAEILIKQQATNAIQLFPITLSHILELSNLPSLHRDPFDRLLVAQARVENITILTNDKLISQYPVSVLW